MALASRLFQVIEGSSEEQRPLLDPPACQLFALNQVQRTAYSSAVAAAAAMVAAAAAVVIRNSDQTMSLCQLSFFFCHEQNKTIIIIREV